MHYFWFWFFRPIGTFLGDLFLVLLLAAIFVAWILWRTRKYSRK